ncbi:NADH:ubiquinone oxidoreductase subunit (chain C) [Actinacidiphila rubida]|uniref:NADH:ubiquinone oxidoreductase subunit (Chain C) n=1 Tax=Actinacidiphila rubida TaxID=310780 RepID=A0A1H8M922_9ACTN|nr:NADH-quinone oxidoreductase subunit C [Actinacidiphila rubida]SEO13760.1 NADH:ubiquinone oxidoreductase subunit (chain C) [Actinacidiphila rubida]
MTGFDRLPEAAAELFGEGATAAEAYGLLTVDVPPGSWTAALTIARDTLGCTFFDWLSAVDEPGTGFQVCAHVVRLDGGVRRLLLRTTVPYDAPEVATATGVYAGAAWHERETHEMFGVGFAGHPGLAPLLLPEEFEGHPLRKDFVLAARVAKAWPGAKEPGESHDGGPRRRQMLPPGVPDPNEWGPLKGQLPPAPARPARTPRAAGGAGTAGGPAAAGERPARRTRSVSEGSASQSGPAAGGAAPVRRARSASEGSATQRATPPAADAANEAGGGAAPPAPARERVPDAPWEQPREPSPDRRPAPAAESPADQAGKDEPEAGTPGPDRSEAGKPEAGKPGADGPEAGKPGAEGPVQAEPAGGETEGRPDRAPAETGDSPDDEPPAGGDTA